VQKNKKSKIDELSQTKINDLIYKEARSGVEFWYKDIWKTVGKCVFCDLAKRYVIVEINEMILVVNKFSYIDGHLMIIPRQHITHLKELSEKQWETVRLLQYVGNKILKQVFGIKNSWVLYREGKLGSESQKTVEHLHIHIIPFTDGIVTWNYQKLNKTPFEVAFTLRKHKDDIIKLAKRYKLKYSNNG